MLMAGRETTDEFHEEATPETLSSSSSSSSESSSDPLLSKQDSFEFRSLVMRAAYLSLDRPDLSFSVKELSRCMKAPRQSDVTRYKRLGRFLLMFPRLVILYNWSKPDKFLVCECDADFGGCRISRKSTSGLYVCWGGAFIKASSKTQTSIALSTQESEFYSIVSCVATALGLQQLFSDVGVVVEPAVYSDASAGISLCKRVGLGKSKHINVQYLWI